MQREEVEEVATLLLSSLLHQRTEVRELGQSDPRSQDALLGSILRDVSGEAWQRASTQLQW